MESILRHNLSAGSVLVLAIRPNRACFQALGSAVQKPGHRRHVKAGASLGEKSVQFPS